MADPKNVQVPQHVQEMYNVATTVQERYAFYHAYFEAIAPNGLVGLPMADVGSGYRKEIRLLRWYTYKAVFSGLVHRPSDKEAEMIAGDEAYTRVDNEEGWNFFWFFTAADTVSFFVGMIDEGSEDDREWRLEKTFHPLHEAQEVHDYLREKLVMFDQYLSELELRQLN